VKKLVLLLLLLFSANAFSADVSLSQKCIIGEEQCAHATFYQTYADPSGTIPQTDFDPGATFYVNFKIKNVGTQPLENLKIFFIGYNKWTRSLVSTPTVVSGVDLDPNEEFTFEGATLTLHDYLAPTTLPDNGGMQDIVMYVSTESNQYFHTPREKLSINDIGQLWAGTTVVGRTKLSSALPADWAYVTPVSLLDEFDVKAEVTNKNLVDIVPISIEINTSSIQNCNIIPAGFNGGVLAGGTYTTQTYPIGPGLTETVALEQCTLKPTTPGGVIYTSTYSRYNGNLLIATWPRLETEDPNMQYYNIWADHDYLASSESTTINVEYRVRYGDMPPGSYMIFSFDDYTNGVLIADRQIDFPAGLAKDTTFIDSVTIDDYPDDLSYNFRVTVLLYEPTAINADDYVRVTWGQKSKTFSPPPPNAVIDTDNETSTSGDCLPLESLGGGFKRITCTFAGTSQKVVQLAGAQHFVHDVQVSGVSMYALQRDKLETLVFLWPTAPGDPVTVTFRIARAASAPGLEFFEAGIILAACFALTFFILQRFEK